MSQLRPLGRGPGRAGNVISFDRGVEVLRGEEAAWDIAYRREALAIAARWPLVADFDFVRQAEQGLREGFQVAIPEER